MRYDVVPPEEIGKQLLLAEGIGDFQVIGATEGKSKAGNDMIKLNLKVWDKDGKQALIFDYLVSTLQYKILHFFEAIGSPKGYLEGEMNADSLVGSYGKCKIAIKTTDKYGTQNSIADYIKKDPAAKDERPNMVKDILGAEEDDPFK